MNSFHRLWLAQTISLAGDFVAVFAVQVAVTFGMHRSARDMAGVFIAGLIPSIILSPFAGIFADRSNPKRVMIASDLARGILILRLLFAKSLGQIYAVSCAMSCVSSFFLPAQAIALPSLVPRERLFAATVRMQQTMQLVRIASPGVASAMIARWGEHACYYVDTGSFVCSAALLATLRFKQVPATRSAASKGSGVHLLLRNRQFSTVVWPLAAATFSAGCFASLASVYVRDVLHRGPPALALMSSLMGAGTVAGAAGLGRVRGSGVRRLLPIGIGGVGGCILLFAWIPRPAAAYAAAAAMGVSVAAVMAAATTLLLGETPMELRGRVSGASASLTALAQLTAMVMSGIWATAIGIRGVFLVSATLLFATAASSFAYRPKLDKIQRASQEHLGERAA